MKPRPAALAFALAVTTLVPAPAAIAGPHPRPLRCGDVITTDARLSANLVDCERAGLVIGADGVTLDLDGHRIDGNASGDGVGIDVQGHRGVTIENGTVREFAEGVLVLRAREVAIRHVTSTDEAHGGILVDGGRGVTITDDTVRRCGAGIVVTRSNAVRLATNRVSGSAFGGVSVFDSRHVVIAGNSVTTSRTDMGIGLVRASSHSAIVGNRVSRSGAAIVVADGAAHNLIAGNVARRNGSGVVVDVGSHDNRVVENLIEDTAFEGIVVVGSDRNIVARNHVARSGAIDSAGGIVVIPAPDDFSQTSVANTLAGNVALDNRGDGIHVGQGQARNILRDNRAYRNTRLGMDAGWGAIDGGGNRAAHNGDPRQCVGVACAPGDGTATHGSEGRRLRPSPAHAPFQRAYARQRPSSRRRTSSWAIHPATADGVAPAPKPAS